MNFRVSGEIFPKIIDLVRDRMEKRDTNFRKAIPLEKRVAIALWRLSSGNSFRTTSIIFAVGKSTSETFYQVSKIEKRSSTSHERF